MFLVKTHQQQPSTSTRGQSHHLCMSFYSPFVSSSNLSQYYFQSTPIAWSYPMKWKEVQDCHLSTEAPTTLFCPPPRFTPLNWTLWCSPLLTPSSFHSYHHSLSSVSSYSSSSSCSQCSLLASSGSGSAWVDTQIGRIPGQVSKENTHSHTRSFTHTTHTWRSYAREGFNSF